MNGEQLRVEPAPRLAVAAAGAVLLMWPCLLNWHPYLFWDTYSYFLQGRAYAVVLMAAAGAGPIPPEASSGWIGVAGRMLAQDASIRSISYSLLLYVTAALGSFWTLAALNAVTAAATIELFLVRLCRLDLPRRPAVFGILAAVSSLPWYATFLMPDLFAGLLILAVLLLALVPERLSGSERTGLSILVLLAITFHSSHLLLAVVLVPLAIILAPGSTWAVAARLGTILVAGVALLLFAAWLAFGRPELAPNSPPFLLARAYADGSVRRYLETRCAKENWVLCDRLDQLRGDANEFLWNKERSYWDWRDQRQRMRDEQTALVARAVAAYPWMQLRASLANTWQQLTMVGLDDLVTGRGALVAYDDYQFLYMPTAPAARWGLGAFTVLVQASAVGGVLMLAIALGRRRLPPEMRRAVVLTAAALVVNAAICGALSGAHDRYEARVIWLVPLLAAAALLQRRPAG